MKTGEPKYINMKGETVDNYNAVENKNIPVYTSM